MEKVLGVLHGLDIPDDVLLAWARSADRVVAADGAVSRLMDLGFIPHLAVGDFDSVTPEHLAQVPDRLHLPDQDRSDADKLLSALSRHPDAQTAVIGMEGDRLDHTLYALQAISNQPGILLATRTLLGFSLHCGGNFIAADPGKTVSLLPVTDCHDVYLSGVEWTIEARTLEAAGFRSLSNRSTGDIRVSLGSGRAILFLEHDMQTPRWDGWTT